ncbi:MULTISPECIES: 2-keto-4-pentenoate hydratase [unclassified Caballeronia]|uniref:2-keto-4-pentenoate hydratase n=1 Tax=unclassified Caballeronia TaxID=2646786 RepID=UPI002028E062|nr:MULTISPECIES: 2-keto-4-pentenoate hydratase [unclassified Caballeronia]
MSTSSSLSQRLAQAWTDRVPLDNLPPEQIPVDSNAAYAVQRAILAQHGSRVGGWKVGAKTPTGPIQGAPLPLTACHPTGARLPQHDYAPLGIELEIAFRFGRPFSPRESLYSDEEVLDSIVSMSAAIEIVASRYAQWPEVDKLAQLADFQNHGALIVGEAVPYSRNYPFAAPEVRFTFDSASIAPAETLNPAGDPRRLLPWLVNHCTQHHRIAVTPDMIVTTGSYTGMVFPKSAGVAHGELDGLPAVELELV